MKGRGKLETRHIKGAILEPVPAASIRDQCRLTFEEVQCHRVVYNKSEQLCQAHNLQRLRGQEFKPTRQRQGIVEYMSTDCSEEGCMHPAKSRGLCDSHYYQIRHRGATRRLYETRRPKGDTLIRDELGRKECRSCCEWLDESEFGFSKRALDGFRPVCRTCRSAQVREYQRGLSPGEKKRRWIWRRYRKTPQWFDQTLKSQGGRCAVCGVDDPGTRGWAVDHDHRCCSAPQPETTCGTCIRGIVCTRCNLTLGQVDDSPELLNKMIDYLGKRYLNDKP